MSESKPKILIIDDEPNNHRVYQRVLEPLDLDITSALSGQKGLEVAHMHDFFLILMDVQMPNMDGFETASLILDHPKTSHIPVIFITAYAKDEAFKFKGYQSGAVDYLTKPINNKFLLSKVTVFLDLHQQKQQLQATLARLELANSQLAAEMAERQQAEQEKEKMQAYLYQSSKMESIGTLAGGVAHNFNNILSAVIGYLELTLLTLPAGQQERSDIENSLHAAQRAAALSTMMLQFVGQGKVDLNWLEINGFFKEIVNILKPQINSQIDLRYENSAEIFIKADLAEMHQLMVNLVINSAEAIGEEKGVITLQYGQRFFSEQELELPHMQTAFVAGEYVYITVSDNGIGLNQEVMERAFEPFFTTKFTGRGMGLATVLGIMRIHKGAIFIQQNPTGHGAVVTVLFPVVGRPEISQESIEDDLGQNNNFSGTVLVVGSDQMWREVSESCLSRMGFETQIINNQDVLNYCEKNSPHLALVLMDISDDNANILKSCEVIREKSQVPVILVMENIQNIKKQLMDNLLDSNIGVLEKPYSLKELKNLIAKIVSPNWRKFPNTGDK